MTYAINRRRVAKPLPKFWRPKLAPVAQLDAKIIHNDLVTRFTDGTANVEDLWDWMETGFTYSQMMRLLALDGSEFTPEAEAAIVLQLDAYPAICERLRKTGRVGLTGPELKIARDAAEVMDGLIDMDRNGIAQQAAQWSIDQMAKIRRAAAR